MKKNVPLTAEKALMRLKSLCERSEYCTEELRLKMYRWGLSGETADKVLSVLVKEKFVDDRRFAAAYAHSKSMNSNWGRLKIQLMLRAKKIPKEYITEALDAIEEEDYEENLKKVLDFKKRQLGDDASTFEGRTKIFRYAASRGYESELISRVMRSGTF